MHQAGIAQINGVSHGDLVTLTGWSANGLRQGYLRIDGTAGSTISSIDIVNVNGDGFMVDHMAFHMVPEPATFAAFGLGGLLILALRRRH